MVPTVGTDQAARRLSGKPPFAIVAIPVAITRPERPFLALAVVHREVEHCGAEGAHIHQPLLAQVVELLVFGLGFGKRFLSHSFWDYIGRAAQRCQSFASHL